MAVPVRMGMLARRSRRRRLLRGEHRGHRQHARQRVDRFLRGDAQRLELGAALRVDLDREADMAVAHRQALDHAERDDVLAAVRIGDLLQGRKDLGSGDAVTGSWAGGRGGGHGFFLELPRFGP
jgi:hypothetical protein